MKLLKSRKGFTLIELLVVIGILAVLAAIAIPSVAGLIDRANVSADKTNSNEMTNAIERFTSEYELYCQDIASGELDPENMDAAQGRVFNVTGVTNRAGIETLEKGADAGTDTEGKAIYRDTKYPVNAETLQAIVENYTKTSSATFEPKQSDMAYWYSPACGVVVVAEPDSSIEAKNDMIQSGKDAKGRALDDTNEVWINLTVEASFSDEGNNVMASHNGPQIPQNANYGNLTTMQIYTEMPSTPSENDFYVFEDYIYIFDSNGWSVRLFESMYKTALEGSGLSLVGAEATDRLQSSYSDILESINNAPVTTIEESTFENCTELKSIKLPNGLTFVGGNAFQGCTSLTSITIPSSVKKIGTAAFSGCESLVSVTLSEGLTTIGNSAFYGCTNLTSIILPASITNIGLSSFSALESITYKGTMAQFRAISTNGNAWYLYVPATQIICSDGTIAI